MPALFILAALIAGCGSLGTSSTVGTTLATFTATAPVRATPVAATATAAPPTAAPSPTPVATATSIPAQPTATATRPSAASPTIAQPPTVPASAAATGVEIRIINFAFDPPRAVVRAGTTVTWRNVEGFHTVLNGEALIDSPALEVGQAYSFTFTQVGEFQYVCGIHPEMIGVVQVIP